MNPRLKAVVTAGALCAVALPTPAVSAPPSDTDGLCTFTATSDQLAESGEDVMTGYVAGGPVAQNGTLRCSIQIGANSRHADGDNGASAAASGSGFVLLSPTLVSYLVWSATPVFLCDQFTGGDGVTYVFDDTDGAWEPAAGNTTAECRLAITVDAGTVTPSHSASVSAGGRIPISGTIEIYSSILGDVSVAYRNFDPPLSSWTCTLSNTSPSVSCTPSVTGSHAGKKFLCDYLDVVAEHTGVGAITGTSGCAGGAAVTASTGASSSQSWSPGGSVPWSCAADPNVVGPWKVTCDMFGTGSGGGRTDHR